MLQDLFSHEHSQQSFHARLTQVSSWALICFWLSAWLGVCVIGWRGARKAPATVKSLKRSPLPGYLIIKILPADAAITLDGKLLQGKGASRGVSVPVGLHRVRATAKGHVAAAKQVRIYEEDASLLQLSLKPLPVSVVLTSTPSGAKFTLNQRPLGVTPLRRDVVPRWYRARASKAGFVTGQKDIHILPKAGQSFHVRLGGASMQDRGHTMRWIPGRYFSRGLSAAGLKAAQALCQRVRKQPCPAIWFSAEQPQRLTWVDSFWLDQREVSYGQYRRCVKAGACRKLALARDDTQPVASVTWEEARSFCRWRGARLPREVEWELAARGPEGYSFPWGRSWRSDAANHGTFSGRTLSSTPDATDGFRFAAPVGSFARGRSPYRVEDLAGNVAEWVADCYFTSYYRRAPERNPFHNPARCSSRVVRGGSWMQPPWELRATARLPQTPDTRSLTVGFRCARSARRHRAQRNLSP